MNYDIYAGLGCGFGGAELVDVVECETEEEANNYAWERAVDEYESRVGSRGLRTVEEIMEQENVKQEEAESIYLDEREMWIDYWVEEHKEVDEVTHG